MKRITFFIRLYAIAIIVLFNELSLFSQFTDSGINLKNVSDPSISWGDFDNDNDLDLLLTGSYYNIDSGKHIGISYLYQNSGSNLTPYDTFPGVDDGATAWGDYNNDGFLDYILAGYETATEKYITKLYSNNGNKTFSEIQNIDLTGVRWGCVSWTDYDNNGTQDILICGSTSSYTSIANLYKNNGDSTFTYQSGIPFEDISNGNADWGDYNMDGYLDLLFLGGAVNDEKTIIYKNNGDGSFALQSSIELPSLTSGDAGWADYNSDGYLDFFITGQDTGTIKTYLSYLYFNKGDVTFEQDTVTITGTHYSAADWGDYNNDGFIDLIVAGATTASNPYDPVTIVYENNADGSFTQHDYGIQDVLWGDAKWADYDNDGDLDILIAGYPGSGSFTQLYNNSAGVQSTPSQPSNLSSEVFGNQVVLKWNKASDTETLTASLTYNIYIGTQPDTFDILSPLSDINTGYRRIVQMGNTNHDTIWIVKNLQAGIYYWSVQTIDNGYKASTFAGVDTFEIEPPLFTEVASFDTLSKTYTIDWGDYDNDNDLDMLVTGEINTSTVTKIFKNTNNEFELEPNVNNLIGVYNGNAKWGDYNNDGHLDILLAGDTDVGSGNEITKIYKNNGNNTFTELSTLNLSGVYYGTCDWIDINNDGMLDIFLTGLHYELHDGTTPYSLIYKNKGNDQFSAISSHAIQEVYLSATSWSDFDNDGDIDLLLCGDPSEMANTEPLTKIYENTGDNTFTEIASVALTGVYQGSSLWFDYNNDGYDDIILTGDSSASATVPVTRIFKNNGDRTFSEQSINLQGVYNGMIDIGDYDNNGYSDIIISGLNAFSIKVTKVYRNNGNNTFTEDSIINIEGLNNSAIGWADYDNDNDLDLFVAGVNPPAFDISKLYKNNFTVSNTSPSVPANLSSTATADSVILNWNKATDSETSQNGISYNIYITTDTDSVNKLSPMADISNGYRKIVATGNTSHNNSWVIKNLPVATYYWSVQAIDNGYSPSAFATTDTFEIPLASKFIEQTGINILPVKNAHIKWADFDNDDDLDVLIYGDSSYYFGITKIYENLGNGTFVAMPFNIQDFKVSSMAVSDYDNDNDLDIVFTGYNNSYTIMTKLYKNNGDKTFTLQTNSGLDSLQCGTCEWVDFDNDGDMDLLLTGEDDNTNKYSLLYSNEGDGTFKANGDLLGLTESDADWADYDNDGDKDLVMIGKQYYEKTILYNNNNGMFSEVTDIPFLDVKDGNVEWGDFNEDGYIDLLLAGYSGLTGEYEAKVYRNDGGGTFTMVVSLPVSGVPESSEIFEIDAHWGDYDNDGDLDILYSANDSLTHSRVTMIARNNGGSNFNLHDNLELDPVSGGKISWADYDNDGDLDILLAGQWVSDEITKLYTNNIPTQTNTLPTVPSNLSSIPSGSSVTLNWNTSNDNETGSSGLTYNIYVGSSSGGTDIVSPMSNLSTGYYKLVSKGNVDENISWTINSLAEGIYYWSVQAIDNNFAASTFAPEATFSITSSIIDRNKFNDWNVNIYPNPIINKFSIITPDHLSDIYVEIFNIQGIHVMNKTLLSNEFIDFGWADKGIYILKLENRDNIRWFKIIKK